MSFKEDVPKGREFKKDIKEGFKENLKNTKKSKIVWAILKLVLLIFLIIAVPLYIIVFQRDYIQKFHAINDVLAFLKSYKKESIFIYLAVQALQIIISVIPGQAFQFAAGYLYGFFFGLILSLIGAFIGTTISFYIARVLGRDAMHMFFSKDKFNMYVERLNSKKAYTIVFIIYLIPGLPKDIVSYAAGASSMRFKPFLLLSLIGRTPGMSGSLLIGALYMTGHYVAMWILAGSSLVIFALCIIMRKQLKEVVDKMFTKIIE